MITIGLRIRGSELNALIVGGMFFKRKVDYVSD
nr:MAG TPA: hypothetical protein [Caudoviricetes sp.]